MKRLLPLLCLLLLVLASCSLGATPTVTRPTPTAQATQAPATPSAAAAGATQTTPSAVAQGPSTPISTPAPAGAAPSAAPATGTVAPAATVGATRTPARRVDVATYPNTSAEAGVALVGQAVTLLIDHYVDPLNSGELYGAAYDGAVAALRASGKTPSAAPPVFGGDAKQNGEGFKEAYLALAGSAGPEVNQTALAYEAIRGVTARVDECHTYFQDPEANRQFTEGLQGTGTYGGIGVLMDARSRPATVLRIFPNTPAATSGLQRGDAIVAVDGDDVSDLPVDQIAPRVRGEAGTAVTLTIRRPGEAVPIAITITRARITTPILLSDIREGRNGTKVGVIQLFQFATPAEQQFQEALDEFETAGVDALVLDLRDNPGGYVDTFARLASRFISGGQTAGYQITRSGDTEEIETRRQLYRDRQLPFAILTNRGSASASEAFSAAAQDYGFARVFGEKTSGCLAVGTNYPLADGSAMSITIEKFLSPNKREINRVGVTPDEIVEQTPGQPNEDPVLDAAFAWLATQPRR